MGEDDVYTLWEDGFVPIISWLGQSLGVCMCVSVCVCFVLLSVLLFLPSSLDYPKNRKYTHMPVLFARNRLLGIRLSLYCN